MRKLSKTDGLYKAFEDAWEKFYKKCGAPVQFRVIVTGEASLQSLVDIVNFAYPVVRAALVLRENGPENMSNAQAKKYVRVLQDVHMRLTDDVLWEPDPKELGGVSRKEKGYIKHDSWSLVHALLSIGISKRRREALDLLRVKKHARAVVSACAGCIDSVNPARKEIQKGQQICAIMHTEDYDKYFYKKGYQERLV